MVHTESAKLVSIEELKDMIMEEDLSHPAVEMLLFVETREKENRPSMVFPFFLEAYSEPVASEDGKTFHVDFQGCLVHVHEGEFGMAKVALHGGELGLEKRIWDKPPTAGLRKDTPWDDEEVVVQ